jgi:hypothetical protein
MRFRGRRPLGVGYSPKSGYDAAMRQVKSWAKTRLPHCNRHREEVVFWQAFYELTCTSSRHIPKQCLNALRQQNARVCCHSVGTSLGEVKKLFVLECFAGRSV